MAHTLEPRIERLETESGDKPPKFLIVCYDGGPDRDQAAPSWFDQLSAAEQDRLKAEAIRANPGRDVYALFPPKVPR